MTTCPVSREESCPELTKLFKRSSWLCVRGGSAFYAGVLRDDSGREISGVAVRSASPLPGFNFTHSGYAFLLTDAGSGAPLSRSFCLTLIRTKNSQRP